MTKKHLSRDDHASWSIVHQHASIEIKEGQDSVPSETFFPNSSMAYESQSIRGTISLPADISIIKEIDFKSGESSSISAKHAVNQNTQKSAQALLNKEEKVKVYSASIDKSSDGSKNEYVSQFGEIAVMKSGEPTDEKLSFSSIVPTTTLNMAGCSVCSESVLDNLGAWRITKNGKDVLPTWLISYFPTRINGDNLASREEMTKLSGISSKVKFRIAVTGDKEVVTGLHTKSTLPIVQAEKVGMFDHKATLKSGVEIEWIREERADGPLNRKMGYKNKVNPDQIEVRPIDSPEISCETYGDSELTETIIAFPKGSAIEPMYLLMPNVHQVSGEGKVFAKSCTIPSGHAQPSIEIEPAKNFGLFSIFFGQAHAAVLPMPVAPPVATTPATQAQQEANKNLNVALTKAAGNFKDDVLDTMQMVFELGGMTSPAGIAAMILRPEQFDDGTQYSEDELRESDTVQSRVRFSINEPQKGQYYPTVSGYHMDDTRIPVKYVGIDDETGNFSVSLEEGIKLTWLPDQSGEIQPHITPPQDDDFDFDNLYVNPIPKKEEGYTEIFPMPEDKDWRDSVLVFPADSGIPPLYIVYSWNPTSYWQRVWSNLGGGPPPAGMYRPHVHHVVFKEGRKGKMQEYLDASKGILEKYGIDWLHGEENLCWAPNKNHSTKAAKAVRDMLIQADHEGGTREAVVEALDELKEHFANETIRTLYKKD